VSDEGKGFRKPVTGSRFEDESGRGLLIVAAESSRWGAEPGPTSVWFELDLAPHDRLARSERGRRGPTPVG
jgi:hypothetical protein